MTVGAARAAVDRVGQGLAGAAGMRTMLAVVYVNIQHR